MCCAIIVECVAHCQVRKRHAPALNFSKKKSRVMVWRFSRGETSPPPPPSSTVVPSDNVEAGGSEDIVRTTSNSSRRTNSENTSSVQSNVVVVVEPSSSSSAAAANACRFNRFFLLGWLEAVLFFCPYVLQWFVGEPFSLYIPQVSYINASRRMQLASGH